jgi:hypothetical protein
LRFALIQFRKTPTGSYLSLIQPSDVPMSESRGKEFSSEEEMAAAVKLVFAESSEVLRLIQSDGSFQKSNVDLTDKQAAALGWKN